MKGIKSFRRTFLLIAALYLACGISLLVWPAQSGLVICYVFGGISLLYGAGTDHPLLLQRCRFHFPL